MTPASRTPEKNREGSTAALRRRLSGDLDVIVLKALRKEPGRRYASVEQFAEDVRRHLEGLPVTARRDSWSYRAGKFAIRHKLAVTATVLVLTAVLGGVAATVREARIAAANQRRAEQRFNDVRKLANSLMFEIHDAIRDLPGSTPARRLLVTRALEYLDNLSAQAKGDASLQKELASAYERVGDVLGYPFAANLGDKTGAEQSYGKALAIREALANPKDAQLEHDLVGTYLKLAQVLESGGNFGGALEAVRKAMPIAERMAASSNSGELADQYAGAYYFSALIQGRVGDSAGALENYRRSAQIRDAALRAHPDSFLLHAHLAADYAGIAKCLEQKPDLAQAIEMQSKATVILEEVVKSNPQNATLSEYLGEGVNRLSTYRKESGDATAALESYRRAHQIFGNLLTADPKNSLAKANFGFSDNGIAESLIVLGRPAEAIKTYRESIATFEGMSPRTGSSRYPRTGLADAYSGLGGIYASLAKSKNTSPSLRRQYWEEARSSCQKSLDLWKDKEKRGELESGEQKSAAVVGKCIAESEGQVANLRSGEAH